MMNDEKEIEDVKNKDSVTSISRSTRLIRLNKTEALINL